MASVSSRLLELFRNLKSDAVPSPPRSTEEETREEPRGPPVINNETDDTQSHTRTQDEDDHEEIIFNEDDFEDDNELKNEDKKPRFKFPFQTKKDKEDHKNPNKNKDGNFSTVNTQATGPVFNIINASGVQVGSNHVYYLSAGKDSKKKTKTSSDNIEKDSLITSLMEAKEQPPVKYMIFVSKNLGENWKSFFVSLGYLMGGIQTLVMEEGITEARYKLLEDWVKNNEDASLGRLAELLWEEGEREVVKEMSLLYKGNKK